MERQAYIWHRGVERNAFSVFYFLQCGECTQGCIISVQHNSLPTLGACIKLVSSHAQTVKGVSKSFLCEGEEIFVYMVVMKM